MNAVEQNSEFISAQTSNDVIPGRTPRRVVIAETGYHISPAQTGGQPTGGFDNQKISRHVAQAVVHDFEAGQIQKQHRELITFVPLGAIMTNSRRSRNKARFGRLVSWS